MTGLGGRDPPGGGGRDGGGVGTGVPGVDERWGEGPVRFRSRRKREPLSPERIRWGLRPGREREFYVGPRGDRSPISGDDLNPKLQGCKGDSETGGRVEVSGQETLFDQTDERGVS